MGRPRIRFTIEDTRNYWSEWKRRNPGSVARSRLKSRYGLTEAEYKELLIAQNGLCAICKVQAATTIDHKHILGEKRDGATERRARVRGLLCHRCNVTVGFVEKSDINRVLSYIREYE